MLNLTDALNVLRLDSGANDALVGSLLNAIPGYIEVTTGMSIEQQEIEPLVDTVSGFFLHCGITATIQTT